MAPDLSKQSVDGRVLWQHGHRPGRHRGLANRIIEREHQHGDLRQGVVHGAQHVETGSSRHVVVEDRQVGPVFGDQSQRLGAVGRDPDQNEVVLR